MPTKLRLIVLSAVNVTPPLLTDTVAADSFASAIDAGTTETNQFGSSSSSIVTVVVVGVPAVRPSGNVSNDTVTTSSSSTTTSPSALKLKVAKNEPRANIRFSGTPE